MLNLETLHRCVLLWMFKHSKQGKGQLLGWSEDRRDAAEIDSERKVSGRR